jgi:hypothetical protein
VERRAGAEGTAGRQSPLRAQNRKRVAPARYHYSGSAGEALPNSRPQRQLLRELPPGFGAWRRNALPRCAKSDM